MIINTSSYSIKAPILVVLLFPAEIINILFSLEGVQDANSCMQPNHFVPLVFSENSRNHSYPNDATKSVAKKNKKMQQNNKSFPILLQQVFKQNIVTA